VHERGGHEEGGAGFRGGGNRAAVEREPGQERGQHDPEERGAAPGPAQDGLPEPGDEKCEGDGGSGPPAGRRQAGPSAGPPAAKARERRPQVTSRSSGTVRVPPRTVMKFVSPSQRGTT